jgi:hypothetical protein
VYFYELHEGDDDVFSDVLLVSDVEYSPDDFFELVQSIRRRIQDHFEDDTLIEGIAVELEREHGFTFISDDKLTAAVNVSRDEEDNFLAALGDEDEEMNGEVDYRAVYADFEPPDEDSRPN